MRYLVVFILCLISFSSSAELLLRDIALTLPPGAELVDEVIEPQAISHQIVMGSLKKINHELDPEHAEYFTGVKSSYTYYLPHARRTEQVDELMASQFGAAEFSCEGRGCGSSSYWANKILNNSILYGPEQFQRYRIHRTESGFVAVYVGQRATRKIYLHIEQVVGQK